MTYERAASEITTTLLPSLGLAVLQDGAEAALQYTVEMG